MRCFNEQIYSAFLDDELPEDDKKRVLAHLDKCKNCRKLVQTIQDDNEGLRNLFMSETEMPDLIPAVMDRIKVPPSRDITFFTFLIYGIFILAGISIPYHLVLYLKSTSIGQHFFSYITVFSLGPYVWDFLLHKLFLMTYEEIIRIIAGYIFIMIFLVMALYSFFIKKQSVEGGE